jgi:hypothetical protein
MFASRGHTVPTVPMSLPPRMPPTTHVEPSGASPVNKIKPQMSEPSLRSSQSQPPPTSDSFNRLHRQHNATPTHSPATPKASPAPYGLRRSPSPVLSTQERSPPLCSTLSPQTPHLPLTQQHNYHAPPPFPTAVKPRSISDHRRSMATLCTHPYALTVHRPSDTQPDYPPPSGSPPDPGPLRLHAAPYTHAPISEGMNTPSFPTNCFAPSGGVRSHKRHSVRFNSSQLSSQRPNPAHHAPFPSTPTNAIPLEEEQRHDVTTAG